MCGTFRTTVSLLFSVGVFDSLALVPSHATGTMLALLALVLPAVLAVAPASSALGSIKSDNGTLYISSSPAGTIMVNEVDLMATISAMQSNIAALQATVAALQSTTATQGGNIDSLTSLASSQGSAITTLQGQTATQGTSIATLTSNVASNTAAISTLQTTVNGILSADATQNGSISSLQTSASIAAANITSLFSKTATLNATQITQGSSITTLQGNIVTIQTTVNNQGSNITTLFATASSLNGGLTTANANLVALNNSVQTTITSGLNNLNTSFNSYIAAPYIPSLGTATCSASNYGGLRVNVSTVMLCSYGASWLALNPAIGSSLNYPAASCAQVLSVQGSGVNGTYYITQTGGAIILQACNGGVNLGGNGSSALTSASTCTALGYFGISTPGPYYIGGVQT